MITSMNNYRIFIDTGAWLARYLTKDQYHKQATTLWNRLETSKAFLYTSNLVLNETFTLLGRRSSYAFAKEKASIIYTSDKLTTLRSDRQDELEALYYLEKFADQKVSYCDCISFVLMKHYQIQQAFSFDQHFSLAGFDLYH